MEKLFDLVYLFNTLIIKVVTHTDKPQEDTLEAFTMILNSFENLMLCSESLQQYFNQVIQREGVAKLTPRVWSSLLIVENSFKIFLN